MQKGFCAWEKQICLEWQMSDTKVPNVNLNTLKNVIYHSNLIGISIFSVVYISKLVLICVRFDIYNPIWIKAYRIQFFRTIYYKLGCFWNEFQVLTHKLELLNVVAHPRWNSWYNSNAHYTNNLQDTIRRLAEYSENLKQNTSNLV